MVWGRTTARSGRLYSWGMFCLCHGTDRAGEPPGYQPAASHPNRQRILFFFNFFFLVVMKWFPLTVEAFTGHARRQTRPYHSHTAPNPHRLSHTGTLCHPRSCTAATQAGLDARPGSRKPKPTVAAVRPRGRSQNRPLRSRTSFPPLLLPCDLQTSRHQRGEK